MAKTKDNSTAHLGARIPKSLKSWLEKEGERTKRKATGELIYILQEEKARRADA